MEKFKAVLHEIDIRIQQDLSRRWEINLLAIIGYLLLSIRITDLWGISTVWGLLIPCLFLLLSKVSRFAQKKVHAIPCESSSENESKNKRFSLGGGCLVVSLLVGCFWGCFIGLLLFIMCLGHGFLLLDWLMHGDRKSFLLLESSSGLVFTFTLLGIICIVIRPIYLWFSESQSANILVGILLIFFGWQYSFENWIAPSQFCEDYKKGRGWSLEEVSYCKKHYLTFKAKQTQKTCRAYIKEFNLDESLVTKCQEDREFRDSLASFKTMINYEQYRLLGHF